MGHSLRGFSAFGPVVVRCYSNSVIGGAMPRRARCATKRLMYCTKIAETHRQHSCRCQRRFRPMSAITPNSDLSRWSFATHSARKRVVTVTVILRLAPAHGPTFPPSHGLRWQGSTRMARENFKGEAPVMVCRAPNALMLFFDSADSLESFLAP